MTDFKVAEKYKYMNGFNSYHETEAVEGALPTFRNSPQKPPFGLYAEKLSGTAFTAPRAENKQTWLYRILPSCAHQNFVPLSISEAPHLWTSQFHQIPNQLRWDPFDEDPSKDFIHGLNMVGGAGEPSTKMGLGIYIYACGKSMGKQAFYNADGDFLIVPERGTLDVQTELGNLLVRSNEIVVVPRGIRFRVGLPDGSSRGYILEIYTNHFELPELGPIGSNGLANARDFQAPVASYEDDTSEWEIIAKFDRQLHMAKQEHSPFDVVAWHGLYYPYKYDLGKFNVIGSTSFDHPDPSIYTVLTCQSPYHGTAIADFQEDTFRPPWYHRNTMSECMGLLSGVYDAKTGGGFQAGGMSLHNVMAGHGPDADAHDRVFSPPPSLPSSRVDCADVQASNAKLEPQKIMTGSMAFMFESSLMLGVSEWALKQAHVQQMYSEHSWGNLKRHFPENMKKLSNEAKTNGAANGH